MLSLDQVLDGLTVEVTPFALCEVRGDGRLDMGRRASATLHYVLAGAGFFSAPGRPDVPVGAGHLVIAPAAMAHGLSAQSGQKCRSLSCAPLGPDWMVRRAGAGENGIIVACGEIRASYRDTEGLFDYLDQTLVTDLAEEDGLRGALDQILQELAAPKPGTKALVRALMQQCMIHILRRHSSQGRSSIPWMLAAQDERLWTALQIIFRRPEAPHSLQSLADETGMSRSAFAEHFKDAFGRGPIDLLKEVRLKQASRLLITTDLPMKSIARAIGYESRSYFTRAFHAAYGEAPADYRLAYHQGDEKAVG